VGIQDQSSWECYAKLEINTKMVYFERNRNDIIIAAPDSKRVHEKQKPCAMTDYNKNKIDVNKSDKMSSYYSCERKSVVE
jgi:hypothetical protein